MLEERLVPGLAGYLDTRDAGGRGRVAYHAALVQMARLLSPLLRRCQHTLDQCSMSQSVIFGFLERAH